MTKKIGKQSIYYASPPVMVSTGTVVGPFEAQSPLKEDFDFIYSDPLAGEDSFEKAERQIMLNACYTSLYKYNTTPDRVDYFLAGDLLNQIITSGFSARELAIPFLGLYGACSTSVEGLIMGSALLDGGFANMVLVAASSHNSTAERQFRYPTEYGNQKKPYSQWTVTGCGAAVVSTAGKGPLITHATIGKVTDLACQDPLNLGVAMAPAAASTIVQHLADTGRSPDYYNLILTGDLGKVGQELATKWAAEFGSVDLTKNYQDCGMMIYDLNDSRVHAGGSGCGCGAVVAFGHIYKQMKAGRLGKVLLVATGALHSPISCQQGENIPCIAHAVSLESKG